VTRVRWEYVRRWWGRCRWFPDGLARGRVGVVQVTAQQVRAGIWMGGLLPAVGTEVGKCIDGRYEAAPHLSLGVTLGAFDCIRKTPVVGFEEDSLKVGRQSSLGCRS